MQWHNGILENIPMNTYDLHLLKPPTMPWVEPGFGGPESVCSLCPPQPSVYPNDTLPECCTSILDQGTVPETRWCGTPAPPSSMDTPVSGVPVQHSCPGVCAWFKYCACPVQATGKQIGQKRGLWAVAVVTALLGSLFLSAGISCSLLAAVCWAAGCGSPHPQSAQPCGPLWGWRLPSGFPADGSGPVALNCSSATSASICASPSDGPVYTALALTPHLSSSWCHRWATAASSSSLALPLEPAAAEA